LCKRNNFLSLYIFFTEIFRFLGHLKKVMYLKINWFGKNALTNVLILNKDEVYIDQSGNVYIDESGNTKLVFKVLIYQDIYRLNM
jgi:hypothetical protein